MRARGVTLPAVLLLGLAASWVMVAVLFDDAGHVPRITIDNDTGYDVHVTLAGFEDGGILPLGVARQQCRSTFEEVLDAGDTWVFHLGAQGREGGAITMTRDELARAGWHVILPSSVGDQLAAAGAPAPPSRACG